MQDAGQVWNALAEIGRQLQNLAAAQTGQGKLCAPILSAAAPSQSPLTVSELVSEFLRSKARAGRSDRYLRAARYTLQKFVRRFGVAPISDVHTDAIEKWLWDMQVTLRTRHNYLSDIRTLFHFAVRRGYASGNPAAAIELPAAAAKETALHSPSVARTVLQFAFDYDRDICRALALRYFAGIRTCESERISEGHLSVNYVEITRGVSKGGRARKRRLVRLQGNLRAWLAIGGELPAPPQNGRKMLEFMRSLRASGIDWPDNVTRHSWCSYRLAQTENAHKTALEAGHTEQMLFGTYRELTTQEAAEEFFDSYPPGFIGPRLK